MAAIGHRPGPGGEPASCEALAIGRAREMRGRIVSDLARRLIRKQELDHHAPCGLRPIAIGMNLHARCRRSDAACGEHALAFDLNHAGTAIAVGPVPRLRRITKPRQLDAAAPGGVINGLVSRGLYVLAVQIELNNFAAILFNRRARLRWLRHSAADGATLVAMPIAFGSRRFFLAHCFTTCREASLIRQENISSRRSAD